MNVEKFWSRVEVNDATECWPWLGATRTDGYGVVRIDSVLYKAHRIAWALSSNQDLPDWMSHRSSVVIDHTCGNKACCNPMHLDAVSQSVNAIRYQRSRFTGMCINGHARKQGAPCKQCVRDNQLRWRDKNRERYNEIARRSYNKNK
jgi:hypothetical protein